MRDLNVSIIQDELDWQDPVANRERYTGHIRALPDTDLIVLPEMFSTGFSMQAEGIHETMDGHTVKWMREQAAQKNAVLTGSLIIEDSGRYKNRMVWAEPGGR